MNILVRPIHLRDVNQTFHTFLDLGKAAVISQVSDLRYDAAALGISTGDGHPWVFAKLLETKRNTVSLTIELEDLHIHLLSDFNDLAWMLDALPRHIGNMEQSVYATQVNKCAVIGEVLDHALNGLAFLQVLQQLFALCAVR